MKTILISLIFILSPVFAGGVSTDTIPRQIQTREAAKCHIKIKYYKERLETFPNSSYYKFLLNKWVKRCEPE